MSEIAQLQRVRGMLCDLGVTPSPNVEIVTASGKTYIGQLVRDVMGNTPKMGGWNSYGSITLVSEGGKVDIDYLDVVTVERYSAPPRDAFVSKPPKRRTPRRKK